jgi:hypothetical protein
LAGWALRDIARGLAGRCELIRIGAPESLVSAALFVEDPSFVAGPSRDVVARSGSGLDQKNQQSLVKLADIWYCFSEIMKTFAGDFP